MAMLRRAVIRPVLLGLLLALMAGCYSSNYAAEIQANTELMRDESNKLMDYTNADFRLDNRQVSSEEMGEFYYVLKKARSFAQSVQYNSDRASYQQFLKLTDSYEQMVKDADLYRLQAVFSSADRKRQLVEEHQGVLDQARSVMSALAQERSR